MTTLSIQPNYCTHSPSIEDVEMTPQECLNQRNRVIQMIAQGEINNPSVPSSKDKIINFLKKAKQVITSDISIALFEAALAIINDRNGNGESNKSATFILEAIKTHKNMEANDFICEETVSSTNYEQIEVKESEPLSSRVRVCPGHSKFFHHYSILAKALRKANEEVQRYLQNNEIKTAQYALFEKNTPIGQESGYFNLLNSIYKYAIAINYTHVDNSKKCLYS